MLKVEIQTLLFFLDVFVWFIKQGKTRLSTRRNLLLKILIKTYIPYKTR